MLFIEKCRFSGINVWHFVEVCIKWRFLSVDFCQYWIIDYVAVKKRGITSFIIIFIKSGRYLFKFDLYSFCSCFSIFWYSMTSDLYTDNAVYLLRSNPTVDFWLFLPLFVIFIKFLNDTLKWTNKLKRSSPLLCQTTWMKGGNSVLK